MLLIKNLRILSVWRLQQILIAVCLLLLFFHSQSSVFSQTTQNQGINNLTAAKVLSNVRKAVKLPAGNFPLVLIQTLRMKECFSPLLSRINLI